MTSQEMKLEIERLSAENKRLHDAGQRALTMKVSEKGALSVYGLGRFPVTLYHEQWTKLLGMKEDMTLFIAENMDKLKSKE